MELYLLRHGIADDHSATGRDADRALTPKGAKKVRAVAERARAAGIVPEQIVTSPYRRAVETARIAAAAFDYIGDLVECAALTPDSTPEAAWSELRAWRQARSILLVGHNPLWSDLYAFLLNAPSLQVDVRKGSLGCIEVPSLTAAPRGVLRWMITSAWCDVSA